MRVFRVVFGLQQFGDAKIEQLHIATAVHKDVRRLDVPMQHELPVRVGGGVADLQEECEHIVDAAVGEEIVDRHAVDVFHHQVRPSGFRLARVDQARDVRMLESRQRLFLGEEARVRGRRHHPPRYASFGYVFGGY